MSANERQVGGEHYKRKIQHWDLMAQAGAGYFAGQITKYTERHSKKNGRQDLEKALHFAEKMHEVNQPTVRVPLYRKGFLGRKVAIRIPTVPENPILLSSIRDYAIEADLTALQERIFELCLMRPERTEEIVGLCRKHLERVYGAPVVSDPTVRRDVYVAGRVSESTDQPPIPAFFVGEESSRPGTPEDGGHHESRVPQAVEDGIDNDMNEALSLVLESARTPPERQDRRRR